MSRRPALTSSIRSLKRRAAPPRAIDQPISRSYVASKLGKRQACHRPIAQVIKPTDKQRSALDALNAATTKAADFFKENCPTAEPLTPPTRVAAIEYRLKTMLEAIKIVEPALDNFYASLSDEQKARFNKIGSHDDGYASNDRARTYGDPTKRPVVHPSDPGIDAVQATWKLLRLRALRKVLHALATRGLLRVQAMQKLSPPATMGKLVRVLATRELMRVQAMEKLLRVRAMRKRLYLTPRKPQAPPKLQAQRQTRLIWHGPAAASHRA